MSTQFPDPVGPEAPRAADPTIGRLVNDAVSDVSTLVRSEISLAKAEVSADAKKAGKAGGMFGAAGFLAVLGVVFLLHTIAQGLIALGLAPWLSYLIVTLLLFVVAGILALLGKSALKNFKGKPERAIASTKQTVEAVKQSTSGEVTARVRADDPVDSGATATSSAGGRTSIG